jgi:histidine phosphotransferase ChpT
VAGAHPNVDRLNTPHDKKYGSERRRFNPESLPEVKLWPIQRRMNAVDLASLLCSRLCHDLMSPVGALSNGIELLADETDPDMREKCLELLADSARASANKLKFFRLAFGAAGGFGEAVDTHEARAALEGVFGPERRIELGWVVSDGKLPKGAVKLLLNLALLAGDALVRGGRLDVGAETADGEIELAVRAEGQRILLDPALREMLTKGATGGPVEPRAAGAWLAHSLAAEAGGSIQLSDPSSDVLMVGASIPCAG